MFVRIKVTDELRQSFPVLFGAALSLTFGLTLGWPSVAYPLLLDPEKSPLKISLDETSLVAGFLMEGNCLGSLLALTTILDTKHAVCLALLTQIGGWVTMFYSKDIFWFLASRFSIGMAHGYGQEQLKRYITETCDEDLAKKLKSFLPITLISGVLLMFITGFYLNFPENSMFCVAFPAVSLVMFAIVPKFVKEDNNKVVNKVVNKVEDKADKVEKIEDNYSVWEILKEKQMRNQLLFLFFLGFVQQYSGAPAIIVYVQLIFAESGNYDYQKYCACLYAITWLISTSVAMNHSAKFNRKSNLLVCSNICALLLALAGIFHYQRDEFIEQADFLKWTPLALLIFFNFFHTFSWGTLPSLFLSENVPKKCAKVLGTFYMVNFSLSAVIATKLFQVFFTLYAISIGFAFFVLVLVVAIFTLAFLKDFTPGKDQTQTNSP